MTDAEARVLRQKAEALDREQWKAILGACPIELKFYSLQYDIMKLLDTEREHERVTDKIGKLYAGLADDWMGA